jgi:hypothetical protein
MNMPRRVDFPRRAIAIFTLLAMLVAPLCASLCGSRTCVGLSSTQSEDCHSSLSVDDRAPRAGVAAIRACGSREFPSAALDETTNSPDKVKRTSALYASSSVVTAQTIQLLVSDARCSSADNERFIANTSAQLTVLRI